MTTPRVTNDQLFDILTTALEGGYAEEFDVLEHTRRPADAVITFALVQSSEGYEHDDTDGRSWVLDAPMLRMGLHRFAEWVAKEDPECRTYLGSQFTEGKEEGWEYLDAIGADAVLQFACFGEVVFG
jgi:hypothetical protein